MKFQKGNIAVMEHAITKKHALLAQQTVAAVLHPHPLQLIAVMKHAITKKHALLAQQTVEVVFLLYLPPHQLPRHRKEVALMEVEAAEGAALAEVEAGEDLEESQHYL